MTVAGEEAPMARWRDRVRWSAQLGLHAPRQGSLPFRPLSVHQRKQADRVRSIVEHAYAHVPYYQEEFDRRGEVVISDLTNRAMVLLNYRLGDVATMLPGQCPCGRSLPMISFLEGRRTEWLQSTSGKLVHPQGVRELLRTEAEVWRYQVVERRPDHFEIAVVTDACDEERLRQRLAAKFAAQFSATTTTTVSFVTKLERTPQGKVRPVISLCGSSVPRAADEAAL
jgi:phenylacetate-coenzyme A ligase PaaK-like adenylate-forming protein